MMVLFVFFEIEIELWQLLQKFLWEVELWHTEFIVHKRCEVVSGITERIVVGFATTDLHSTAFL